LVNVEMMASERSITFQFGVRLIELVVEWTGMPLPQRGKMPGDLTIRVRYKKYATPWFEYLIVSKKEMKRILEGTGWRIKRFVDSKGSVYIGIIGKISKL